MAMDLQTLVQALANTLDPSLGKQAEAWLDEVRITCTRSAAYLPSTYLCTYTRSDTFDWLLWLADCAWDSSLVSISYYSIDIIGVHNI
jgi:hypothetical protein